MWKQGEIIMGEIIMEVLENIIGWCHGDLLSYQHFHDVISWGALSNNNTHWSWGKPGFNTIHHYIITVMVWCTIHHKIYLPTIWYGHYSLLKSSQHHTVQRCVDEFIFSFSCQESFRARVDFTLGVRKLTLGMKSKKTYRTLARARVRKLTLDSRELE